MGEMDSLGGKSFDWKWGISFVPLTLATVLLLTALHRAGKMACIEGITSNQGRSAAELQWLCLHKGKQIGTPSHTELERVTKNYISPQKIMISSPGWIWDTVLSWIKVWELQLLLFLFCAGIWWSFSLAESSRCGKKLAVSCPLFFCIDAEKV